MKTVAELLRTKPARAVVRVRPEQTVLEAIKVLATEDIGAAVVMNGEKLVGIFSERDYTRKIILKGRSSDTTRVEEVMTANVITVTPRTKARECMLALEGAAAGALGASIGLVSGIAMSLVLVHVVNRQSFHWSVEVHWPVAGLALLLAAIVASCAAGARASGALAVRAEAVLAVKDDA